MARRVRDASLESRTARAKLEPRGKPYYRSIGPGLHLGYRKGDGARRWVARVYSEGQYKVEVIADADDIMDADGINILNFGQAQDRARALITKKPVGPYTVAEAIAAYIVHLEGRSTCKETAARLAASVPQSLQDRPVDGLARQELVDWHRDIAKQPPRVRTSKGGPLAYREVDFGDPEVARKRKVSANLLLIMLKAALNHALLEEKVSSNKAWSKVTPFEGVNVARTRYLSVAEAQRLINASDPDFRLLVQAALFTGCRVQELARLVVADFNPDSGTLLIQRSKSMKPRHVMLGDEGIAFFGDLVAGRAGSERMLGKHWGYSSQERPMRKAVALAKIDPPASFHALRHTWASLSVMSGMPLMVVAKNLGHVDTKMVEKHYGHLSVGYVQNEVRKHAPKFGLVAGNVEALR
jgi:integrase